MLNGKPVEAIFVYIVNIKNPHSLDQAISAELRENRISPDLIFFLTSQATSPQLEATLRDELLKERFELFKRCRGVAILPFSPHGEPTSGTWIIGGHNLDKAQLQEIFKAARASGFEFLSNNHRGIVTLAPPGTYFVNPSGRKQSYFLRAGLLCRDSTEASFVAFSLLPLLSQAHRVYGDYPNIIWVDTVGIAYIAYALAKLGEELSIFNSFPEIRSFSSYGGLKELGPKSGERPIYLISASTSGGLATTIQKENLGKIDPNVISTIIGAYHGNYPQLIFMIPESWRGPRITEFDTLREIRVSGEDFLFEPGKPTVVDLKKSQLPINFSRQFKRIQGKELIHCFKKAGAGRPLKSFCFDGDRLASEAEFREWVATQARGNLPASVKRIVHQEDDASFEMAKIVQAILSDFCITSEISSISDIECAAPNTTETVVVVAAVVGSGMELMRATKALRSYQPNGSRYFLIGILVGRSYRQLQQLKSNLRKIDGAQKYAVETWCEFSPGGEALLQFRDREHNWLKNEKENADETISNLCEARLNSLSTNGIIRPNSEATCEFLSLTEGGSAFEISDGFALWEPNYSKKRCPSDVLFTVACWLQHARENQALKSSDRLEDGGFGQTIISPDCFIRFTDPVLQSAILRCARDSELDYRSSAEHSARAAEIISKFCLLQEEAILEFLMAIAFSRMRLLPLDRERVATAAMEHLKTNEYAQTLIPLIRKQD